MAKWQVNLIVLWVGQFLVMAGMTMIVPFLPLYLQELGLHDPHSVATWAGVIFAGNFVTSFIFQPIWGGLADRYGRKVMLLRSGFGMAIVMTLMGFSTSAWHLLLLRLLNGTVSGFVPAGVALMSATTPREKVGFAMGTLQSGSVAGSILGPFLGGLLAEWIGFRNIFFVTGATLFAASLLAALLVKETFDAKKALQKPKQSMLAAFNELRRISQLPSLYSVTFLIQFSLLSVMPLLPLFVQQLHGQDEMLAFYAGLVGSVTGFSNMIASPVFGKLSDRIGPEKILVTCLLGAAVASVPQAFVHNVWQLCAARFFLGIFLGGLLPTVNALIRKYTPNGMESRSYSFNTSALALGNMLGPVVGGAISGVMTIQQLFLVSAVLLLINGLWARKSILLRQKSTPSPS
ncbi:MFS transporter [Paenibacillus oleatilyticus]|uniref:MFS transporter n=1 Tax=Paenibacillus oleatilyticus TaxID=2594886 RepID=A0ABV4V8K9_9BACL|nr:MFS transporter [Paenibacillus oleatilyticus]MBU7318020.1 MFS transporter [Paenibacillus oleatilyticus]